MPIKALFCSTLTPSARTTPMRAFPDGCKHGEPTQGTKAATAGSLDVQKLVAR